MTRKHVVRPMLIVCLLTAGLLWNNRTEATEGDEAAKAEIVKVVETSYVHGAFNEQNTAAMRQGFHPSFKIHGVREGQLSPYPLDEWIAGIEKRKAEAGWQPQTWEHRIPYVDVTGDAAVVKIELFRLEGGEKKHVFTDYLSLLKLEGGWKITDKVYHRHP